MSAVAMGLSRPPAPAREKLSLLCVDRAPGVATFSKLVEIAALPYVESVLALPDLHLKDGMEVPSSLAITTSGAIVPEFTSVAINDGMGVVVTDLERREITLERVERFFTRINAHSAAHVLDTNRYSLSAQEMPSVILQGGRAVVARYGLDPGVLDRMESGGCVPVPGGADQWRDAVPGPLWKSRVGRSEMGLDFGGNHFLEFQAVDRVLDAANAARWGLAPDQVVVMYHLGPGPFSGTLLHHYSRRQKLSSARVPLFFLTKLLFHYGQRRGRGAALRKWSLHFRRNRWTAFPPGSEEGLLIRQALALAINFGFAYRLATVAAIRDALHEALSPRVEARLLCDVSHNSIAEEPGRGGAAWTARHNACRLAPGGPAIVAGSHDVPSYLGCGLSGGAAELHSYDHGAGHLIHGRRRAGRLGRADGTTLRLRTTRGRRGRVLSREELPVLSSEPIDRLMKSLEMHGVVRPVVRLRPRGTLNN